MPLIKGDICGKDTRDFTNIEIVREKTKKLQALKKIIKWCKKFN